MLKWINCWPTNAIDEKTGQNKVEDVEHWSSLEHDGVRYVGVGFGAARVDGYSSGRGEGKQVKLSVGLVVSHVAFCSLLYQVNLR